MREPWGVTAGEGPRGGRAELSLAVAPPVFLVGLLRVKGGDGGGGG